jgi:hypothetical protein
MTRRNKSVKQKNYSQLTQGLSEVNIGQEYRLDVKGNKFVRVTSVCARPEVTHHPDPQKGNLYNSAISRSYPRSKVTKPTEQERYKETNQCTSTVINNSVYKPVNSRSNSRSKVTEPTEQEKYKERNQRTSVILNSSVQRPVIKRSNSVPIDPERQKETNQHASTFLERNACEPVASLKNSESAFTESTVQDRQKHTKQPSSAIINSSALKRTTSPMDMMTESVTCVCPTEVTRVNKYQPVINRSDNRTHNSVTDMVTGESTQRSLTVRNRKLHQSIVNWIISTETATDSASGLGPKDVTQHPLHVRSVSEYQPVISSNTHGVTEYNSGSQKGESIMTQCLSAVCADQPTMNCAKIVYEARNPLGQRVHGQVTVRPLIIETETVYQVIINRPLLLGATSDSEEPNEVTRSPLAARDVGASQPASDGSAESDCECQESLEVAPQCHASGKDGCATRTESVDASAFWFLYVSVLMWVLLIVLWFCK